MSIGMVTRSASRRHGWRSCEPLLVLVCFVLCLTMEGWMSPVFAQLPRLLDGFEELALVGKAGSGGCRGSVCFDQLSFRELSPQTTRDPTPVLQATSAQPGAEAVYALDGVLSTAWKSDPAAGAEQMLTVDFRQPREFGGLVLHWLDHTFASRYNVEFSDDGSHWRAVRA